MRVLQFNDYILQESKWKCSGEKEIIVRSYYITNYSPALSAPYSVLTMRKKARTSLLLIINYLAYLEFIYLLFYLAIRVRDIMNTENLRVQRDVIGMRSQEVFSRNDGKLSTRTKWAFREITLMSIWKLSESSIIRIFF